MTRQEKQEIENYKKFMADPQNEGNCQECPANEGFDEWQGRRPCGQFRCWVAVHNREED